MKKSASILCFCLSLPVAGCSLFSEPARSVEEIKQSGKLLVLTRNSPAAFHINAEGRFAGPEYDLVQAYAESLGVTAEYRVKPTTGDLFDALDQGRADLIAAGLTHTDDRRADYRFGPSYQEVEQQVVCHRNGKTPRTPGDLIGLDLLVEAESNNVETLETVREEFPDLEWEETDDLETEQILEKVWNRDVDCTVVDSHIFKLNRRYFPELVIAFNLKKKGELAWVLPPGAKDLQQNIEKWFRAFRESGGLQAVMARHYDYLPKFDYVNTLKFHRHIRERYPKYRDYFMDAAKQYGLSPVILAAQAYQESKWNPRAKSPTEVKGLMMLTLTTAKSLGIRNRLDAKQSIYGGARYLAHLKQQFSDVPEPNRTWLALAAYNVGLGHLRDAQILARRQKKDPKNWDDLKETLPLLRNKKYYKKLKYGYARGLEPVRYVHRIREYAAILTRVLRVSREF